MYLDFWTYMGAEIFSFDRNNKNPWQMLQKQNSAQLFIKS